MLEYEVAKKILSAYVCIRKDKKQCLFGFIFIDCLFFGRDYVNYLSYLWKINSQRCLVCLLCAYI